MNCCGADPDSAATWWLSSDAWGRRGRAKGLLRLTNARTDLCWWPTMPRSPQGGSGLPSTRREDKHSLQRWRARRSIPAFALFSRDFSSKKSQEESAAPARSVEEAGGPVRQADSFSPRAEFQSPSDLNLFQRLLARNAMHGLRFELAANCCVIPLLNDHPSTSTVSKLCRWLKRRRGDSARGAGPQILASSSPVAYRSYLNTPVAEEARGRWANLALSGSVDREYKDRCARSFPSVFQLLCAVQLFPASPDATSGSTTVALLALPFGLLSACSALTLLGGPVGRPPFSLVRRSPVPGPAGRRINATAREGAESLALPMVRPVNDGG